jgi:H+/Cl- antiporter ClcA
MRQKIFNLQTIKVGSHLVRWFILIAPLSIVIGLLIALFLWLLEIVTETRINNQWLVFLLPLAGIVIYWMYEQWGKQSAGGNNVILDEIHSGKKGIPIVMAPLILITTVITHLFGGSAGREGTAVQIGGSVAAFFYRLIKLNQKEKRILLLCGVSAGFGAVFGTPLAGTIFALEVLYVGNIRYYALLPCLFAAIIADFTTRLTGILHTSYAINFSLPDKNLMNYIINNPLFIIKIFAAGILFGLTAYLFSFTSHFIKDNAAKYITNKIWHPVIGGILVVLLTYLLGTNDYLGLGVYTESNQGVSIVNAFTNNQQPYMAFGWKLLLTAITLSFGFKGGEVTPLFFIGATLGNTLAHFFNLPLDLLAGLGFVSVFAGATNTPLACTIMGIELFGGEHALLIGLSCFTAFYFSGKQGIYSSQKVIINKVHQEFENL